MAQLAGYFRPYAPLIAMVVILLLFSAWAQVTQPDLTQAAVDCYLNPVKACTYAAIPENTPNMAALTIDDKILGLGGIVLRVLALYLSSALAGGIAFFLFAWSGQHVIRNLREQIIRRVHSLSLGYYAENEAGNIMSRVTSDIDTINQVMSFALLSVVSGVVLVVWIVIKMLQSNSAYALISFIVLPLMIGSTLWLSTLARRAFRKSRAEMGNVNAELQESLSGVREVQAFNREQENIDNFRKTNASNRDVNIRAVSYTSALAPTLDAFNYLALAIVVCVGGLAVLGN
jgi:ATP-binding cassette subfamily B protein